MGERDHMRKIFGFNPPLRTVPNQDAACFPATDKVLTPSGTPPYDKVTFIGIDWGRKEFTACACPRCRTTHRWRIRVPKRCRHCGLAFNFTANEAATETRP